MKTNKPNKKQLNKLLYQIFGNLKGSLMIDKFDISLYFPIGLKIKYPSSYKGFIDITLDFYPELNDLLIQVCINQYLTYLHYRFYTLDPGHFCSQELTLAIITLWVFRHTHPSGHAEKPLTLDRIKLVSIFNIIQELFLNVC